VNARKPGSAEARLIPGIGHHFTRYASSEDALADRDGNPDASPAMAVLIPWLKRLVRLPSILLRGFRRLVLRNVCEHILCRCAPKRFSASECLLFWKRMIIA